MNKMTQNELRIGNLVYDTKGEVNTVCVETFVKFNYQIKPIELNEGWLEKLGLNKSTLDNDFEPNEPKWYSWIKGAFNLEIQENGEIWFEVYSHYIHVKWVHQLQNLYFALTEEELIIK